MNDGTTFTEINGKRPAHTSFFNHTQTHEKTHARERTGGESS
jgi:hypothetical protein